nr:hypothetical protein [Tanacetum cinerariifolium]
MSNDKESSAACTDNRALMLEENDYESWKIHMKRYNRSKPQRKAIWKSIVKGPALHPMTVAVTGVANVVVEAPRPKRDEEFTAEENARDLADIQATSILSQGTKGNQGYGKKTYRNGKKVIYYNCRGEGHVAMECKEPKKEKDTQYYKDKMMLSDAKDRGVILDAEAEVFLADVECTEPYDESLVSQLQQLFKSVMRMHTILILMMDLMLQLLSWQTYHPLRKQMIQVQAR